MREFPKPCFKGVFFKSIRSLSTYNYRKRYKTQLKPFFFALKKNKLILNMVYAKLKGRNGTLLYISFCISFFRKKNSSWVFDRI